MIERILRFSLANKFIVLLFSLVILLAGLFSLSSISVGAVPDVTNNQVQIITTSRSLSTEDVEKFLTLPVELEIANLPGVLEIRSISKFGLSVVTVVFEESMGTYLPRQLITERLDAIKARIPEGFGTPFMGPISTGLGELVQYTVEVEEAYKDAYTLTDLRALHDWVIARQLAGIPGIIEVITWGGNLKQYEIAVDPVKLNALNISLDEVFAAVNENNGVASGAYIEKNDQAYFIRADGQLASLEEIEQLPVTVRDRMPVRIKDVAKVGIGSAPRFGAITANGEGEKVMGQLMMLKGADESQALSAISKRFEEIKAQLPEGVYINPFLERSELVGKTSFTVAENLMLGCLIVIFVVVLLLGNWRSGLVVASVIPFSLLFALSMMRVFGVDANLMSLGAIDFGIIIDGAVIIVDFLTFYIIKERASFEHLNGKERQDKIDSVVAFGTHKMMHSAIFGQLIILIVFIPIFSLSGVEGKMFIPMAQVFSFALLGAMLLCFTYVPVLSSLVLRPKVSTKSTFSQCLFSRLNRYHKIIAASLRQIKPILTAAVVLLVIAGIGFSKLGGEFVPTLDEGDFVIQPVLKTGTSLEKTIEITTRIEQILLEFPEVQQAVSRIGAAEVPTDPMSMEESDVIITLSDPSSWQSAETKDELAEVFKERIESELSQIEVEFTQPIEMRFNELITGVRADLAIKVFGEDLEVIARKTREIADLIQDVEGVADMSVEKIEGLPQLRVVYKRLPMAQYGVSVAQINDFIATMYAGKAAGQLFEGERTFDIVVRADPSFRASLDQIRQLTITSAQGEFIPLSVVADISEVKAPAKIARDSGKRRASVGINVRNRDLQSVVDDVQALIAENINLPNGYYISYGGQFENLQSASKRLFIAIPIALFLILLLLYFAFKSLKEALMIFSAIPFAAVGGIAMLYARSLPFSISAGVGFIALFGIAVLNGIVLIEEFNSLKQQGVQNALRRVMLGTRNRLRPVLLTAFAAALGFLPMAVSSSAGAEIQRPLASVVIGGLISSTVLTLVVLPLLYYTVENWGKHNRLSDIKKGMLPLLLLMVTSGWAASPTNPPLRLDQLLDSVVENHPELRARTAEFEGDQAQERSAFSLANTSVYYQFDQNNLTESGAALKVFGMSQEFEAPSVYLARAKALKASTKLSALELKILENAVFQAVAKTYYNYLHTAHELQLYQKLSATYTDAARRAQRQFDLGQITVLEKLRLQSKADEVALEQGRLEALQAKYIHALEWALSTEGEVAVVDDFEELYLFDEADDRSEVVLQQAEAAVDQRAAALTLARQGMLPGVALELFRGREPGNLDQTYDGIQASLNIPLFNSSKRAAVARSKSDLEASKIRAASVERLLEQKRSDLANLQQVYIDFVLRYRSSGQQAFEKTLDTAEKSYRAGAIDYLDYVQLLEQAQRQHSNYLTQLKGYHNTRLELLFLTL
ncbi:MAG: CusA/CzcA family heavy metal efflux RND transporter [Flavobacteriaceae bacterium]